MNPTDLRSGFYRITADAQNPALDKRVNSDWRAMRLLGGSVLCCVEREGRDRSVTEPHTEVRLQPTDFGTVVMPGTQYESNMSVIVGWRYGRYGSRFVPARDSDDKKSVLSVLLDLIEPFPVVDVDMALYLFNAQQGRTEIKWRDVAIELLLKSTRSTQSIFYDASTRVGGHWLSDDDAAEQAHTHKPGARFDELDAADAKRALR